MAEKTKRTISWTIFFGIAFLMIGIGFASFWSPAVKAVTTSTVTSQVQVGNATPTVSDVELDLPTALTENGTTTATCTATITDTNGGGTVDHATATMYLTSAGASCDDDGNDCYTQIACNLGEIDGNNVYATCTADIWFFATPTDAVADTWDCDVIAEDNQTATATNTTSVHPDMPTLNALQIITSIDYNVLSTGATSTDSEETIATTTGNAALDLLASSTDFILAGNGVTIGGDEQVYSLIDDPYESMTSCSTTSWVTIHAVLIKPTQTPSNSVGTVYWKMRIPESASVGTYNSTTSIVATPDTAE